MPEKERHWWLRWLRGLASAILAALVAVIWLGITITPDGSLDWGELTQPAASLWILLFIELVFVAGVVSDVIGGARARERHLARRRALMGDPNAIPRAKIEVDTTQAPDLTILPDGAFRLSWQATIAGRRMATITYWILQTILGAFLIFMFIALVNLASTFGPPVLPLDWRAAQELGILALFALVMIGIPASLMLFTTRSLPERRRPVFGVTATGDGLTSRAENGKERTLPWGEVRLLEIFYPDSSTSLRQRVFRLSGAQNWVEWRDIPPSWGRAVVVPEGIGSPHEYEQAHQLLINLISAKTGLVPRSFGKEPFDLSGRGFPALSAEALAQNHTRRDLGCLGVALALAAATGALLLLAPLSQNPLPGWIVGGALVLAPALAILRWIMNRLAGALWRRQALGRRPATSLPMDYDPDAAYAVIQRTPLLHRLWIVLLGGLLLVALLPLAILLFPDASASLLGVGASIADGPPTWLTWALACVGGVGALVLMVGFAPLKQDLRANQQGLSIRRVPTPLELTKWSAFTALYAVDDPAGKRAYWALHTGALSQVNWRADLPARQARTTPDGARLVTADEFAAIVAARTELTLIPITTGQPIAPPAAPSQGV